MAETDSVSCPITLHLFQNMKEVSSKCQTMNARMWVWIGESFFRERSQVLWLELLLHQESGWLPLAMQATLLRPRSRTARE
jgi:hypothetical protein